MGFEDMIFEEMNGHPVEEDKIFVKGYNKAIDDALNVVEWDGYTLDIKERIERLKK